MDFVPLSAINREYLSRIDPRYDYAMLYRLAHNGQCLATLDAKKSLSPSHQELVCNFLVPHLVILYDNNLISICKATQKKWRKVNLLAVRTCNGFCNDIKSLATIVGGC
jgi:hypothetical protein